MSLKIIFVRHGETDYNVERRLQGWIDVPLNRNGLNQALKVANRLKGEPAIAIYSSDHKRASTTARRIARSLSVRLLLRRALREDNLGILEGWKWETEVDPVRQKVWDERELSRARGDLHWKKHGGESHHEHTQRIKKLLQKIEHEHEGQTVILVTHGGTLNRIMEIYGFRQITDEYTPYNNTSITIVTKSEDGYQIEIHNDTSHL